MKTNFLLHFIFGSHSYLRKDCANKYESMKSCVFKYTASLFIFLLLSLGNAWGATKTETFESKAAGSNYQSTVTVASNESSCGISWEIYYGTVSTANAISGTNSAAMRLYSAGDYFGYLKTTSSINNLSQVDFKAKAQASNSAVIKINIEYSIDNGENWSFMKMTSAAGDDYEEQTPSTSATAYTAYVPTEISGDFLIKFSISSNSTKPTSGNVQLTIDDIVLTYTGTTSSCAVFYNKNHENAIGATIDSDSPYEYGSIVPVITNEFTAPCGCFFAEWNTKADGSGKSYLPSESFTITQDTILYAQWQVTNYGGDVFTRISSVGDLNDGDEIIFVNQAETYACGIQQNANNRTPVPISTSAHSYTFDRRDLVQVFTVKINGSGQYGFHTGCGYIYSASSSANNLKTNITDVGTAPAETSAWTVDVSDGVFTITNATNISYYLAFNGTSYFSQYTGTYKSPYIYKRTTPANYAVSWKVSGQNYTTGDPTTETTTKDGIETLPASLADNTLNCANKFMGWSESELTGTGHSAPADLFTTSETAPTINEDKTFHAIFATESATSVTSTFSSKAWDDAGSLWKSYQDGTQLNSSQGVQVTTTTTGANATTNSSYYKVTSVVVTYSTNASSGAGSITITLDETPIEKTITKDGGIEDRPITFTPISPISGVVNINVSCTTNSIYIKSVQINYTALINYQTYCTYTYTDAKNDHLWSTADNWISGSVPTINDRATITKPVTVDVATAKAKDIVLDRSGDNTGSLTISANKALEVAEKVRVWHGSAYGTTTESDLLIESSASGNGTLIFENNENQATVQMYCKANSTASPNPTWQYIGTPFIGSIPLYNYYNGYMYKWGNGWESVDGDDEMEPFVGYSVSYPGEGHIFTMEGELVSTLQTRVITVESHKNKVVANSWTAPIQIKQLREADFVNLNRSVYFYNTGYTPAGTADVTDNPTTGEARYAAGTYISLPIHAAKYTSSDSVISSMQGFYVKNATESEGTLTLNYAQHVVPAGSTSIVNGAMHAPKRVQEDEEPVVAKILASGTNYDALLVLLERGDFSFGYDDGWDGDLMGNNTAAPRIYTRTETGTRDVVSAVPDFEGMTIYFRAGTDDNKYTFHFTYDENEEPLYLVDTDTNEYKRVLTGNSYTFYTSDNLAYGRFYLTYRAPSVTTDIDTNGANESTMKAIKYIENDNLYILRGGVIYDATGRRANNSTNH